MGGHAHQVRFGPAHPDVFADPETPFPQARPRFNKSEFNTLSDHLHVPFDSLQENKKMPHTRCEQNTTVYEFRLEHDVAGNTGK